MSDSAASDDSASNNNNVAEQPIGIVEKIKKIFHSPTDGAALSEALQNGNGIVAGLSQDRRDMIERVIAFDDKQVHHVMAPRADIIGVDEDTTLTELLTCFSEAGHSRLPIYRGDLDDPRGMVHIKDVIGLLADPENHGAPSNEPILSQIGRKVIYVPPSMPVTDLLLRMQAQRIHMALVIDEFGGTDGLVTIEDLVEEIVGEIHDEHDADEELVLHEVSKGVWEGSARLPMEDLEKVTGHTFDEEEEEIDTLGGLVFTLAGRVPLRGEVITDESGFEFEVLDADARRIRRIRFTGPGVTVVG